jgi:hypothetical protein
MVVYGKKIEGACQRGRASEREREREREADDTARGAKCEERGGA